MYVLQQDVVLERKQEIDIVLCVWLKLTWFGVVGLKYSAIILFFFYIFTDFDSKRDQRESQPAKHLYTYLQTQRIGTYICSTRTYEHTYTFSHTHA